MIDDLLLDTNTDNEMLVYYYSKASYSGYIDSNVWTSGDSNHVQQYKNIVNNHNFFQDSATISQQAWRAADLAFESKFSEPSGEYEEIVVIVGDGMPRRQYNMNLDTDRSNTDNTWVWTNPNDDSDMKLATQKGYVTRNGVKLYVVLKNTYMRLSLDVFSIISHIFQSRLKNIKRIANAKKSLENQRSNSNSIVT